MTSTRREFLVGGLSAGAAAPLVGSALPKVHAAGASAGRKMVYLQVRGGFDWLNVMVPADDPIYNAARPNLGIPKSKTLTLQTGSSVYLAPAVASFKALFDRGEFAFLQNVGYPRPNLSHFESEKKYYAADPSTSVLSEGWIARYLRLAYTGTARIPVMDIENRLNGMLVGWSPPVLRNPAQFQFFSDSTSPSGTDRRTELAMMKANAAVARGPEPFVGEIGRGMAGAFDDSTTILSTGSSYTPRATYPSSRLSTDLQIAARYITGGLDTEIYVISTGGFDTHANEVVFGAPETGTLATRIQGVADSVKAFIDDLKAHGKANDVIVVMQTEFGRRLGENGSLGTDHGHGALAMVAGVPVNAGLYGQFPDLSLATTPYHNYYIPFNARSTDFRSIYATLLGRWFGVANPATVLGGTFPQIPFV